MTIQEITDLISFREDKDQFGNLVIKGGFRFTHIERIDAAFTHCPGSEAIKCRVREGIRRDILAKLFEDRRKEINELAMEVRRANPMAYEFHEALDRLMNACRYTPPAP